VKHQMPWTAAEVALLREKYPTLGYEVADLPEFKHRTPVSVIRKAEALRLKVDRITQLLKDRVGYLDIETSHLNASFGIVYSWVIKEAELDVGMPCGFIRPEEIHSPDQDRRLLQQLLQVAPRYTRLITYYGSRFDIPFLRSRALIHKFDFIPYGKIEHLDLYYVARSKLRIYSRSLEAVCETLGIPGKTPLKPEVWMRAWRGDPEALAYIFQHNKADAEILEALHQRLARYIAGCRRYI